MSVWWADGWLYGVLDCKECKNRKAMEQTDKETIPQWVIDYDKAGHQSSAGKAIRILRERLEKVEKENVLLNESNTRKEMSLQAQSGVLKDLTKEIERLRKHLPEIWSLWESMAECGELKIGPKFSANYERLKSIITIFPKGGLTKEG